MIERNTPVPIEQTRTFTTFQDDQESVKIRVYQGESREAEDNELLGQFEFSGFAKGARAVTSTIDVTFEINADGIVNVTARDRETGQEASTRITLSSGLSEGELEHIIEENRTERVSTDVPDDAEVRARCSSLDAGRSGATGAGGPRAARRHPARMRPRTRCVSTTTTSMTKSSCCPRTRPTSPSIWSARGT